MKKQLKLTIRADIDYSNAVEDKDFNQHLWDWFQLNYFELRGIIPDGRSGSSLSKYNAKLKIVIDTDDGEILDESYEQNEETKLHP